jgi:hypothetical protein
MKIYAVVFLIGALTIAHCARAVDVLFNNQQLNQGLIKIKGVHFGHTTGRGLRVLYTLQTGVRSNWPLYASGLRLLDDNVIGEYMQNLVFSFKHPNTVTTTF